MASYTRNSGLSYAYLSRPVDRLPVESTHQLVNRSLSTGEPRPPTGQPQPTNWSISAHQLVSWSLCVLSSAPCPRLSGQCPVLPLLFTKSVQPTG
ncbi:uncharacterized protein N7506_012420 [Penicillium brevicompactum]|uniref:uncharacterized protein n=1 Tax=Penicillium brevicompactum TaxID=5074 RepID=UPI002542538E|nr:uncharacterized protein N7506_012339 [Penicillium brevicompactum]XP_056806164.1 uncharacterized protein N7506_012345 [Penicillium brevicompactum]XP_056806169.1 uncharacterized protein N7506_012355 [Penicillium brevicompactum]XP_056806172.1 uncharacterized protein N7506_012364 [Penicillium brevicompactum]XP_056806175.1 uncharacterized protein N7506_012370 [Penicillium brevicompactum]XP_056806178.1 uncharacterized protein N7506_012376 [Penicillium brevicompactum]XP_056806181.1 uncharacterize